MLARVLITTISETSERCCWCHVHTRRWHCGGCVSCPPCCRAALIAIISCSLQQYHSEPAVCFCYPTLVCTSSSDLHSYTRTRSCIWPHKPTLSIHMRVHTRTHAHFGMQDVWWECSYALTGEEVWQAQNKTEKWRLEMCLVFLLTFPLGSIRGQSIAHRKATFRNG